MGSMAMVDQVDGNIRAGRLDQLRGLWGLRGVDLLDLGATALGLP